MEGKDAVVKDGSAKDGRVRDEKLLMCRGVARILFRGGGWGSVGVARSRWGSGGAAPKKIFRLLYLLELNKH